MQPEPDEKRRRLTGTVATILFSLVMTGSGLLFLTGAPQVAESLGALGYPGYLAKILGTAKLMGVAALWLPVPKTVREWAYAGFAFNLAGAVASHLAGAGPRSRALQPAILLLPLVLSYLFRHRRAPEIGRATIVGETTEAWR